MSWKATVREPVVAVPEGQYNAMVTGVESMKGPHGAIVRIAFVLQGSEDVDGRAVSGVASKRLSENTKLGRWVSAILGRSLEVGEEVHGGDLVHHDCTVVIRHRPGENGQVFGNVVDVMAAQV